MAIVSILNNQLYITPRKIKTLSHNLTHEFIPIMIQLK